MAVELSQKTMFVVVFSDLGGVWLVLWWTDSGHQSHFVVVLFQQSNARVYSKAGQGTLVVVPADTGVHVRQDGSGQGRGDRMLTSNPQRGLTTPFEFLDGARHRLKVDVKGGQCRSGQLWSHCTQQEKMSLHPEFRGCSKLFILQLPLLVGTDEFRNKFHTTFEWAVHTTATRVPAKSRPF